MKVKIVWQTPSEDTVDLTDYGYGKNKSWNDLTDSEQNEILIMYKFYLKSLNP